MELTEKQQFWKSHLEAAEVFDGSLVDYARTHDLEVKKLYVYKTALREREALTPRSNAGFVRVSTQSTTTQVGSGVGVMLPNGVRLSLPSLNEPGLLERLARL